MDNFLWHKISSEEQEEIKLEAKRVMDSFSKSLEKVEKELTEDFCVKRENQSRKETKASSKLEFREVFFENAPSKSGDMIKSEKGKWKS
ncbi:MAG: hypothetical protein V1660_04250 [archaeon]